MKYQVKEIEGTSCRVTTAGEILSKDGKVRKPVLKPTGYLQVGLYYGKGVNKWYRVHRLVAMAFIPNPENKPFVNHINGVKTDNCVENLEWVTHQENMEHAENHNLIKRGDESPVSVLSEGQAEDICKLLEMGYRNVDISKSLGISKWLVSSIRYGVTWFHVSCKYNIPKRSTAHSVETIHWICKKIEEGLTQGQILALSDNKRINKYLIQDLRRKHIYKYIVEQYNI